MRNIPSVCLRRMARMLVKATAVIAFGITLVAAGMGFQNSTDETTNKQAARDIRQLIPATLNAHLGPTDDPDVAAEVQRDREFVRKALGITLGPLQGAAIQRWGDGDALIAKWLLPGDSPYRGAWVRDTPTSNYLLFQVAPQTFSSPEAIKKSLDDIVNHGEIKVNHVGVAIDTKGTDESGSLASGLAMLEDGPSTQLPDWNYFIYAYRHHGTDFIILEIGKSVVPNIYPEDMVLVPDRFPSLKTRANEWPTEQIMREVGKGRNRDLALSNTLGGRHLSQADFDQIFAIGAAGPAKSGQAAEELRSFRATLMWQIADAGGGAEYRQELLRVLQELSQDPTRERDLGSFLLSMRRMKVDLSSGVLDVMERGVAVKEGIAYLSDHGQTQQTVERLKKLATPPDLEREKNRALDRIERRKDHRNDLPN